MNEQELQQLVARVTPDRVRELVLRFEPQQPAVNRNTVPVYLLLDEFGRGLPPATGGGRPAGLELPDSGEPPTAGLADAVEVAEVDMRRCKVGV